MLSLPETWIQPGSSPFTMGTRLFELVRFSSFPAHLVRDLRDAKFTAKFTCKGAGFHYLGQFDASVGNTAL